MLFRFPYHIRRALSPHTIHVNSSIGAINFSWKQEDYMLTAPKWSKQATLECEEKGFSYYRWKNPKNGMSVGNEALNILKDKGKMKP